MMLPTTAPITPTKAPLPNPWLVMKATTTSPIPKAVPKLVSETNWYFLKYWLKFLSFESEMMAGLSLRKVITAPSAATPGRLYNGRISGLRMFSNSRTTPNSANKRLMAPINTQMAMM